MTTRPALLELAAQWRTVQRKVLLCSSSSSPLPGLTRSLAVLMRFWWSEM